MNKPLSLLLLLVFVPLGFPQEARKPSASNSVTDLQSMVDTERAFAKMSEEQGIRPAFMAFIADDGVLFRPTAVKGKQWMKDHPLPPSDKRPHLTWYPTIAGIGLMRDMGYTTGPWEFKADIKDAKPSAWGHFLTVWKRQPDRSWKFAIDLGISNPKPDQAAMAWQLPNNYREGNIAGTLDATADTIALLTRDREFSASSATRGARAAFVDYAAPDVRVYRDGKAPFAGRDAASSALPATPAVWTWSPAAGEASSDLGYTYGSYNVMGNGPTSKVVEAGNYFRIWKLNDGSWQVLFDLTNPIPDN